MCLTSCYHHTRVVIAHHDQLARAQNGEAASQCSFQRQWRLLSAAGLPSSALTGSQAATTGKLKVGYVPEHFSSPLLQYAAKAENNIELVSCPSASSSPLPVTLFCARR